MLQASITAIEYHLPRHILTNKELADTFPDWSMNKIEKKTGIVERHIADPDDYASNLAVEAGRKLFSGGACRPENIDFLLLCTQTPDYLVPSTACLVQNQLGIPRTAGALDFNLGCTGFIYGLSLAKGLVETGQAKNLLLITTDTYSKLIHPEDRNVRTLFGDGAAATLIQGRAPSATEPLPWTGPFIFGTDGSGGKNLMARRGGMRGLSPLQSSGDEPNPSGHLYMNGPEVFKFTLQVVPECIQQLLTRASISQQDVDLFVFHQANQFMLDHLREKMNIEDSKFPIALRNCGNTVSSTIPIALKDSQDRKILEAGQKVMLVGFGVGYSWGACLIRWGR
ncbi:MAG: 3-oxoacyl-ACP synthase [Nitrospinae bacterium CG11_big_fil_rev_8_21_14_0_20_56_8]|nr:MAG: 3-oxoacyl-ACP synthase [Nitrospinae bacterium CG11_big_fil_rev_8_21_14_0_20_56_8]